jgi:Cd2+/Zn2+-exporting ATPase
MGKTGTDAAIENADIILMNDDLEKINELFTLSKKTVSILKQNIFISLAIKALFLLLATMGIATLWMAIFADDGVTLLVIANSLRLLKS